MPSARRPNRITITPREAAALSRLLDAYTQTVNDADDPGMDDLRSVNRKVFRIDHDHAAYDDFLVRPGAERAGASVPIPTRARAPRGLVRTR